MYNESNGQFVFFWKESFSNWYISHMVIDHILYICVEQYMMHQKAVLFGDLETARKIMKASHPREMKALGRLVENYDEDKWADSRYAIVKRGCLVKFLGDNHLKARLLATNQKYLVEASPEDKIWGIGKHEDDPTLMNILEWGENLLGRVLMDVREILLESDRISHTITIKV